MAEKEGSAVPPQARGSWTSFLKVWNYPSILTCLEIFAHVERIYNYRNSWYFDSSMNQTNT